MKKIYKRIVILSMVGLMQVGLSESVIEASPPMQQLDSQDQVRHEAENIENERHERAIERRSNESDRGYEERKNHENERHERKLWLIARAIIN